MTRRSAQSSTENLHYGEYRSQLSFSKTPSVTDKVTSWTGYSANTVRSVVFPGPHYREFGVSNPFITQTSLVHLIKRPRVRETRVPDLVDRLHRMYVVFDLWSRHHRLDRSSAHTSLELLCKCPVAAAESLARPSTFPAEHGCPDLCKQTMSARRTSGEPVMNVNRPQCKPHASYSH